MAAFTDSCESSAANGRPPIATAELSLLLAVTVRDAVQLTTLPILVYFPDCTLYEIPEPLINTGVHVPSS